MLPGEAVVGCPRGHGLGPRTHFDEFVLNGWEGKWPGEVIHLAAGPGRVEGVDKAEVTVSQNKPLSSL